MDLGLKDKVALVTGASRGTNPSARAGRVEEVGALVAFLASRHAGYIHGANLRIDGGAADAAV